MNVTNIMISCRFLSSPCYLVIGVLSLVSCRWHLVLGVLSLVSCHWCLVIGILSLVSCHWYLVIGILAYRRSQSLDSILRLGYVLLLSSSVFFSPMTTFPIAAVLLLQIWLNASRSACSSNSYLMGSCKLLLN